MKTKTTAYALRLPVSIKAEAERLAAEDGTSLNQFVATAVAEKVSAMRTAKFFAERKGRTDWELFDRIMTRDSGDAQQPGDEVPAGYQRD